MKEMEENIAKSEVNLKIQLREEAEEKFKHYKSKCEILETQKGAKKQ